MKRSGRLRPMSPGREAALGQERIIKQAVHDRDGRRCRMWDALEHAGHCMGPITYHHLRKAGVGGHVTMSNGLTLCVAHNEAVEFLPRDDMVAAGLVIPAWCLDPGRAWTLLQLAGFVDYWWDGTPGHRPRPDAVADAMLTKRRGG